MPMPHVDVSDVQLIEPGLHFSLTDILLVLAFLFIMYLVFRMSP